MTLKYAFATLVILLSHGRSFVAHAQTPSMLEIRVDPPKWVNGCLDLTVERVNVSGQNIYIPDWEGVVFLLSARVIHHPSGKDSQVWLPFYGLSDMIIYGAQSLNAGSKIADHFCLPETFGVVNPKEKTRRQIRVGGHAKIVAGYFPTEEDWKANEAANEKDRLTSMRHSQSAALEIQLPCSAQPDCIPDCPSPPPIIDGESILIPDVHEFDKDWNDRGKHLSDELRREYPICSAKPTSETYAH